jgi:hypothetical protein
MTNAVLSAGALAGLLACGCGRGPTAPSTVSPTALSLSLPGGGAEVVALQLFCPPSLLIGEKSTCVAGERLSSGQESLLNFSADVTWSSTPPDVVSIGEFGIVTGRLAGQAVVKVAYRGREVTATIDVIAVDAVRITAAAEQGRFRPGDTVTMWLQGYYSVASAESGRLSLRISDQNGTVTTTAPSVVAKGGDYFLLSATFEIPQTSTEVCRTAVLQIASVTIEQPQPGTLAWRCITINR